MEIPSAESPPLLSTLDFETIIESFPSASNPLQSLNLLLRNLPRLPSTLKPSFLHLLFDLPSHPHLSSPLPNSIHTPLALRPFLLSLPSLPPDPSLSSATSLAISLHARLHAPDELSLLVDHLLSTALRRNNPSDRHSRALACECLRELELAFPLLLSTTAARLWSFSHLERTHIAHHYALLLATVVLNILRSDPLPGPIFANTSPLTPFRDPGLSSPPPGGGGEEALKDIRKLVAFLLDRPRLLTPVAIADLAPLVAGIVDAAADDGLRGSVAALVKVKFFWLIHTYDPLLCHVSLALRSWFPDAFSPDDDRRIALRLAGIASESQQPLAFRLLALHWILGFASSPRSLDQGSPPLLSPIASQFYPSVYDPLALKAAKLDVLARIAAAAAESPEAVRLMEDGLVCVSAFKWLPTGSTETVIAFRAIHRFLLAGSSSGEPPLFEPIRSALFHALQSMVVDLALRHRSLVPVIAAFVDRLMECGVHRRFGELLLQRMDEYMLPKLTFGYSLSRYFPLFERIGRSESIPPRSLLELLSKYVSFLVRKHGPDTCTQAWSHGSRVLGICRTMLLHHRSSRIFQPLSRLLVFTCQFFPDLDVRDSARICLRMLLCIPGRKLRHILSFGDQVLRVSSSHPGSLFQVSSSIPTQSLKKTTEAASSYIHLERANPLLVRQSWSLAIMPILGIETGKSTSFEGIKDANICGMDANGSMVDGNRNDSFEDASHGTDSMTVQPESSRGKVGRIGFSKEPLHVTDSRVAEILEVLRRHFICIPDFRHMPGIKIQIPCTLRFESEPFCRAWEFDLPARDSDGIDSLPALYASVIKCSSSSRYGSIPLCRVPFLLGEPFDTGLSIIPIEDVNHHRKSRFKASVIIELEPREPVPGFVNASIEANGGNGQIISGPLQDISVGVEDMFLKAHVPPGIPEDCIADYLLDLFNALWEACGDPANVGRETFRLKGGRGIADISGTRSVKLLEVPVSSLISSIERHLAPFVVGVSGSSLISLVRNRGVIKDVVWKEDSWDPSSAGDKALVPYSGGSSSLQLAYYQDASDADNDMHDKKVNMGCFYLLIFLPPRFHLLLRWEVCDSWTLVRIRTDHWPCLAYVDEYLEALFFR